MPEIMTRTREYERREIFFFNDTATTEIYTLSLHDALPIWLPGNGRHSTCDGATRARRRVRVGLFGDPKPETGVAAGQQDQDRKSTRLNSSHANISYAVFCLKKKN